MGSPGKDENGGNLPGDPDQNNKQCEDPSAVATVDCFEKCGCHIIDGCSIPDKLLFKSTIGWADFFNFGSAEVCCLETPEPLPCNEHDRCYQSCRPDEDFNSQKKSCDLKLYEAMTNKCLEQFNQDSLSNFDENLLYLQCLEISARIKDGIDLPIISLDAYCGRQITFCGRTHVNCLLPIAVFSIPETVNDILEVPYEITEGVVELGETVGRKIGEIGKEVIEQFNENPIEFGPFLSYKHLKA